MENKNWKRVAKYTSGIVGAISLALAPFINWDRGTVIVSSVPELIEAIEDAAPDDIIIISTNGSPYRLQDSMHRTGHLFLDTRVQIKGQSGDPDDVILEGTTNRIMFINKRGVTISGITFLKGNCRTLVKTNYAVPGEYCRGGAISLGQSSNECVIANCVFKECEAEYGGAVSRSSGSMSDTTTSIRNSRFENNRGTSLVSGIGGGVFAIGTVTDCSFVGCKNKYGGAVGNVDKVINCEFQQCESYESGGGGVAYKSNLKSCEIQYNWNGGQWGGSSAENNSCPICGGFLNEAGECVNYLQDDFFHECDQCHSDLEPGGICSNPTCSEYPRGICKICGRQFPNDSGEEVCPYTDVYHYCPNGHELVKGECRNYWCSYYNRIVYPTTTKGGLLLDCLGEEISVLADGENVDTTSLFHNTSLYRSKVRAGNATLFSGNFYLQNSLIYEGRNITLIKSSTNDITILNCTIVSNQPYKVVSSSKADYAGKIKIYNCLFFGNTYTPVTKKVKIALGSRRKNVADVSSWLYKIYPNNPLMMEIYYDLLVKAGNSEIEGYSRVIDIPEYVWEDKLQWETFMLQVPREIDILSKEGGIIQGNVTASFLDIQHSYFQVELGGNIASGNGNKTYDRTNLSWFQDRPDFQGENHYLHPYALKDSSWRQGDGFKYTGLNVYCDVESSKDLAGKSLKGVDIPSGCYLPTNPRKFVGFRMVIR